MNALLVCLSDFRAPGARQTLRLASALSDAGHDCLVMIEGDLTTLRFSKEQHLDVEVDSFGFIGPRVDQRTRARVRSFRPDVVHCYEPRTAPLSASLQFSHANEAALCVRFADDDESLAREAGGLGLRGRLGRPAMLALGTFFPRKWPYKHPLFYHRMLQQASGFDAITPALAQEVTKRYGVACRGILPAIPRSGVPDPVPGLRKRLGLPADADLVLYTGSVFRAQYPDLDLLLRGFAEIRSRGIDAHLVHTGRISERYELSDLQRLGGGEPNRVHFLGFLEDPRDVDGLLAEAAVLVQPGAPSEFNRLRLPAKVHDYLLAGRPTVTFTAGFGELLRDRVDAVLTKTADPAELADALEWVLKDPEAAGEVARNGRLRALELFDPKRVADETAHLYRAAITGQAA